MTFDPVLSTSYEYIHYTSENIATLNLNRTYSLTVQNPAFHTPNGLWLSIAGTVVHMPVYGIYRRM